MDPELTEDISYLCAITLTFNDENTHDSRHAAPKDPDAPGGAQRLNPFLDALARLAVSKSRKQVIALGATWDTDRHIELYIAINPADSANGGMIARHLGDICTGLLRVHAAIEASPDSDTLLRKIRENPHRALIEPEAPFTYLRALELDLYKYSYLRTREHFRKNQRHAGFAYVLNCIRVDDSPVNTPHDLSEYGQRALERLGCSENIRRYLQPLKEIISELTEITKKSAKDANLDDEAALLTLRRTSVMLAFYAHLLKDDMQHFDRIIFGAFF